MDTNNKPELPKKQNDNNEKPNEKLKKKDEDMNRENLLKRLGISQNEIDKLDDFFKRTQR